MVSANAMPTAASSDAIAAAVAELSADACCAAWIRTSPVAASVPVPIRASVVTFESTIEMAGATATPPPFAPMRASALTASPASAESTTFRAPVTTTPSVRSADVRCVSITRTNDTPTPASPVPLAPSPTGSAVTAPATSLAAMIVTSPPVRCTVA